MTKPKTKNQRLVDCFMAYRNKVNRAVTLDEVANWTMENGLHPVPKRGDSAEVTAAWEQRFAEVSAPTPAER